MQVRRLNAEECRDAIALALTVFMRFEAPDYGEQGVQSFRNTVGDAGFIQMLMMYGAFEGDTMVGMLAARSGGSHIALFFVEEAYQRRGIGRALFKVALASAPPGGMTVNASPYAVPAYGRLGFVATDAEQVRDGIRYTPMRYDGEGITGDPDSGGAEQLT